jgi:hypothetical protein
MVTMAINSPAIEVFGLFQIFEMGFMRNAPRKDKGGLGRLGYQQVLRARERFKLSTAQKKSRPRAGLRGQAAGLDFSHSPNSSATVVAAHARGGEPLKCRQETAPSPGTIRWGTANPFAELGISVSCLATS